jgi:molecular chaperone DnaK
MSQVIGIDLGTTNTVVAVVRDGRAEAIADETGNTLIPSVVSFHPNGTVLVGRAAKERRLVDASNTIYSVKRLIGRSWDSDEVKRARSRFAFQMREGPGQATLVVGRGETYTLPEISAFVLRRAKQVAEAALGERVERAVITVPANFNDLQRAATKVAGRVAGLEVLRILNEPTAAALAYGYGKATAERLAVYDFGGGTFDVTLLDLSDNVFEVLATAGNTFLGGDDIDIAIADRIADQFLARHRYDPRSDPQVFERLRASAESMKRRLSSETEATVELSDIAHGTGGKSLDLSFRMTRIELERLVAPIVDRTFDVCQEALSIARLSQQDFERVLLVGGSTRIPFVRRRVEEFFQRELKASVNPDEAIALGAAIQANALGGAERRRAPVPKAPAAARRPNPANLPPPRARAETIPGVAPPSTQSFADAGDEPTQSPVRSRPPREESVAFALNENDLEEITQVPPGRRRVPPPAKSEPGSTPYGQEDIITKAGAVFDTGEDEPTLAGRGQMPSAPFGLVTSRLPVQQMPPELAEPIAPPGFGHTALISPLEQPVPLGSPEALHATLPLAMEPRQPAPLLVDVTPLTLVVETVQGYCDAIIARNTPVPCEQSRDFVTASDGQALVRVRVAQGESKLFQENTLLGEVELSGLPQAPRGSVQITVTFALDASGMLNVSARETSTGRATQALLRLVGLPQAEDVLAMAQRQLARQTG